MRVINFADHVAQELERVSFAPQRRYLGWSTGILAALALLAFLLSLLTRHAWWLPLALSGLAVLSAAGLAHYRWVYRQRKRIRGQLTSGLRGQRLLTKVLDCLDDRYYLINNLKLPARADDVDHLVVGPNGVFALETKHHRGRIFYQDSQWYQSKISRSGRPQPDEPIRDPVQQLKRNVDYLRSCINATDQALSRRTGLWIEGAVVFSHPATSLDLPPEVEASFPFPVLKVRDLPGHIVSHVPRKPHTAREVREIVGLLGHLQAPEWASHS